MANITHFRGEEILCEVGYQGESIDKTDVATAVTPTESLRYIQSLVIKADESLSHAKTINGGNGRNVAYSIKGSHNATATMRFQLAKDANQTDAQECYFLKMAIDGSTTDSTNLYTIPATTNEYGGDYLKVFTLEAGYNKADNITAHKLTGCIVNKEVFHAEMDKKCEWTWDIIAQVAEKITAFTGGSVSESTEEPFHWGDVKVTLNDTGGMGTTTLDGTEMFEHTITNNITAVRDLANATSKRTLNYYELGRRDITGQIRVKLTTADHNGQDIWEDLYNDASGTATPTEGVVLKDISCRLYIDGTYYVDYAYHDAIFDKIDDDLIGSGVATITIPWTAKNVVLTIKANASITEPTNWA